MTSSINSSAINTSYPVAGQDNNSQGFRDNFTAIQAGLAEAAKELTALQANALISLDLATSSTTVVNNMQGSTIYNGLYRQFNGVFYNLGNITSSGSSINVDTASIQRATMTGSGTLTFQNWGPTGTYSLVRLILQGDQSAVRTVTLSTSNSGVMRATTGWNTYIVTSAFSSGGAAAATTVTLASGTSFAVGQLFVGSGVLPNTYITNVAGAVITINQAFIAQASGNYSSYSVFTTGTGPSPITVVLDANNHVEVIEAWTVDGGAHVYVRNAGEYSLI
jgi:hypothetical protein